MCLMLFSRSLHHSPSHHQGGQNKQAHNFGGSNASGQQDRSGQHTLGTSTRLRSHSTVILSNKIRRIVKVIL